MEPPTFLTPNIDADNFAPATNPGTESQPIKRKRLTQACDACRKKKVKCSGDKPSCNNCLRLNMTCTYLPSTRKRGPRVGLVESLEKRLQQMEKLLQPLKEQRIVEDTEDKKPVKKPRLNSKNSESNNSDISINNYNEGQTEFINIFSQTQQVEQKQSQCEQNSNVENNITSEDEDDELIFFGNSAANPGYRNRKEAFVHCDLDVSIKPEPSEINEHSSSPESNNSIEDIPIIPPITAVISNKNGELPPSEIVLHLAACFFRHMDTQMPMFHEATFMNQLRQNKVSPILVYAMCAVSARYSINPSIVQDPPYKSGEPFAAIALNKYLFDTFDFPSIENVQGLILLTKHMYGIGKGPRAWMFTGMAVRMAQELGLHKIDEPGSKPSNSSETFFIQKEIRRRTFWSCFLLDRFAACALGRPTLIDEDDCEVRLPCHEAIWDLEHPFESPLIGEFFKNDQVNHGRLTLTNNGMSACLVSVTALLGRVCQHVNRSKPYNALPPWDPNSQFTALENELDTWYRSLTPYYTYKKEKMQQLMADGLGTAFALVHLLYCSAIVALNRPNIDLLQNDEVEDRHVEFMRASAERCSDAAQLISSIAEDINQYRCHHLCPFSLYPIFVTTQIHINNTYHSDIRVAEKAEKNLSINEELLKSMGPYWAMASKLLQIVVDMRKTQANNQRIRDVSLNKGNDSEQEGEISTVGLKTYWNRVNNNNNSLIETNLDNISSIILPEQLSSPRWLNDTTIMSDSWTNFLRSPGPLLSGPFSPSLLRIMKKENDNSNQDNYDYFSQDVAAYNTPPAFVYDGYPMIDMSSDWPTTGGRVFPLNRPIKHWGNINGNIINSIEDTPSSTTTFTPLLATNTPASDINIDTLLIQ